jgi:hypothetical protein
MATTPSNDKQRLTISDLEQLKTHELADLLSNTVLVLRRLPDVPFVELRPTKEGHQIIEQALQIVNRLEADAEEYGEHRLAQFSVHDAEVLRKALERVRP